MTYSMSDSSAPADCSCTAVAWPSHRPSLQVPASSAANESGRGKARFNSTHGSTNSEPDVHHIVMGRSAPCAMLIRGLLTATVNEFTEAAGQCHCEELPGKASAAGS